MSRFADDELPFDELDPCCQKEIINQRKKREVDGKLGKVDRSTARIKAKKQTFSFQAYGKNKCFCCQQTTDYAALASFKRRFETGREQENEDDNNEIKDERNEESDEDDDLLDFEIPLTAEEQLRMMEVKQYQENLQIAKDYGLSVHWEDSLDHILEFTEHPSIPLILHVYQKTSTMSAMIDYAIEDSLCGKYLGTRFRRIEYSYALITDERLEKWKSQISDEGAILCFKQGNLVTALSNYSKEFGDHPEDVARNLIKHLDFAHVLQSTFPDVRIIFPEDSRMKPSNTDDEGEEEADKYCDDPDCLKRYPHEHVGRRSNQPGVANTTASFLLRKNEGEEALAPNLLQRY
jgi:hypothetical protein